MKVTRMYLVTWLQRTTIHLKEMHDFFRGNYASIHLDATQLDKYRKALDVSSVELTEENDFEVLRMKSGPYHFSVIEDGIFALSTDSIADVNQTRKDIEKYHRDKMGPALAYLFSRGARLPKSLCDISEFYPIIMTVENATENDVKKLYTTLTEEYDHSVSSQTSQIFFGKVFTIFRLFKRDVRRDKVIDDLVANVIFLEEFKKQLRDYLNIHRSMWDHISEIRESYDLRYKDFPVVRRKIMDFLKTLLFINARLNQMGDIAHARYVLLRPEVKGELEECNLLKFENMIADLRYMKDLWAMTIEYVKETLSLLESLYTENTQRELNALKIITMVTAITGFFGMNIAFPWNTEWHAISSSSFIVVTIVASVAIVLYYILKYSIYHRKFIIRK
ncbi:hypothetical protein HY621_00390 [Candidatus Uhrbacteria bacterium]|nr:hypothetical protein [Candidatus Uhrbacteria bacterium]